MPANINPIYSKIAVISGIEVGSAANTRSDGSGTINTDIFRVFMADSTNGSWVSRLRLQPTARVAATATAATVFRVYISSQQSGAVLPGNCWPFQEIAAPSVTADQTTTATNPIEVPLNFALPPSYTILVSSHVVNNANTSWTATVFGGNY